MSDYLSNIAARSLNLTDVVKPRLATLFEPRSEGVPQVLMGWKGRDNRAPTTAGFDDHRPGVMNAEAAELPPQSMEIGRTQSNLRPQRETASGLGGPEDQHRNRLDIGYLNRGPTKPPAEASADSFNLLGLAPAGSASHLPPSLAGRSMDIHKSSAILAGIPTDQFEQDHPAMNPPVQPDAALKPSVDLSWRPEGGNDDAMQSQDKPGKEKRSDPESGLRAAEKKWVLESPRSEDAGKEAAILPESVTRPLSVAQQDNKSNGMPFIRDIRTIRDGEVDQMLPARPLPGSTSARVNNNPVPGKIIVQPDVAARMNRADAKTEEPVPENQPEPTIQVTIGRIEVRAVSQPPVTQKERWKPPVMGLDEYLSRERGGL